MISFNKKLNKSFIAFTLVFFLAVPFIFQPQFAFVFAAPTATNLSVEVVNDSKGVLGKTKTVTVQLKNTSSEWIFNVGVEVELDSGMELDTSQIATNSTELLNGDIQKLLWKDIKDLAPAEEFSFTFDVKLKEEHRGSGAEVNFDDSVTGQVSVKGSTDAQDFDDLVPAPKNFIFQIVPFEVILSEPGKLLKGAGTTSDSTDDKFWKEIKIEIINNSKYPATINLENFIANGVQVSNFSSLPKSNNLSVSDGSSTIQWDDISIDLNATRTITYRTAIFDKRTENGSVNSGAVINDGTELPIALSYEGYLNHAPSVLYDGNVSKNLIAKDIILDKSVSAPSPITYGSEFIYTLTARVNQYHDMKDIVLTDTLGDGQEYQDSSYAIPGSTFTIKTDGFTKDEPNSDGKTVLKWAAEGNFVKEGTYSLTFKTKVNTNWYKAPAMPIVAGDRFTNTATVNGINVDTSQSASDGDSVHVDIPLPTISKKIISVNGVPHVGGSEAKANIGDIVKFEVTYDASDIKVKQKDVEIVDIFPQGTKVDTSSGKIVYTGSWESATTDFNTSSNPNVLRWTFAELNPNTTLTVQYEATVENEAENKDAKQTFNLAKMAVKNSDNIIQSERAQVELVYTEPILGITKTASKTSGLKGGEEVTFTITLNNTGGGAAYDVKVSDVLPEELENPILVTASGVTMHTNVKTLEFTLENLIPGKGNTTIIYKATVISPIGNLRSFQNTATIDEYANRNDSSTDTRIYKSGLEGYIPPSTSVPMTAEKPTITMAVHSTATGNTNDLKVGDWVIYKVEVPIPANTTAYNGYVDVDIPHRSGQSENQTVDWVSTTENNDSGTTITPSSSARSGYNIKWDTSNPASGTLTYYIRTTIAGPTTPNTTEIQNGKAIFTWKDKATDGAERNTDATPDVSVTVGLPQLKTEISTDKTQIAHGDTVQVTFTVKNDGKNTAHRFVPTVAIPAGFTINNISDSGSYVGDTNGGAITFLEVSSLNVGASKTYTFEATLSELQPSGSSKTFIGNSGAYFTNVAGAGIELSSVLAQTTVTMPNVTIAQEIDATSNPNWNAVISNFIRPGDTVDYKITVTVPKGTVAYDLAIEDTLPADFEIAEPAGSPWGAVSGGKTTMALGIVDASTATLTPEEIAMGVIVDVNGDKVIEKTIKLKAKTGVTYGATKDETNKVNAIWKTEPSGENSLANTNDKIIAVREPNLAIGTIISSKTEFNNTDKVITVTIPVQNNRNTPAYSGSFELDIPAEFEVVTGSINEGGVISDSKVIWTGVDINNNSTKNFVVQLKLKDDGSAGAGKLNVPVVFTIDSYQSRDNTDGLGVKTYPTGAKPTKSTALSIAPVTVVKTSDVLTDNYVRPGDTITYNVAITVPEKTTAYGLSFKDVLGPEQELVSITDWKGIDRIAAGTDFVSLGNLKHGDDEITDGVYNITVVAKVKTDATYNADTYTTTNRADLQWKDASSGTTKNTNDTVSVTVKQPKFTASSIVVASENDITTSDGTSKITVQFNNEGEPPAYHLWVEVPIPEGLKVVNGSISHGGELSPDGRTVTWKNLTNNSVIPEFIVEQDSDSADSKANKTFTIEAELIRYRTKPSNNPSDPYDSGNSDYNDGRVETSITGSDTVKLVGDHTLSAAVENPLEEAAGETVTFTHTLTNTGAGKDVYIITGSAGYPAVLKFVNSLGNDITLANDYNGDGSWTPGDGPEIFLEAGESIVLKYELTIPITSPKGQEKTHTLTATSKTNANQKASQQDTVKTIGIDYNGTTFDGITEPQDNTDWQANWTESVFGPGQSITLAALTSHDITKVEAKIKSVDGGYIAGTDASPIVLTKSADGKWENSYRLPDDLSEGRYFVEYYAYNSYAGVGIQDKDDESSPNSMKQNNYFEVSTPELNIKLDPGEKTVVSGEYVTFTLTVDNSTGLADAYHVIPKVTLPAGVRYVSVSDFVYGDYDPHTRTIEFYVDIDPSTGDIAPYHIERGDFIEVEFTVITRDDLSAKELLNFMATTGTYYTAVSGDGSPAGTAQTEKTTSAVLKTKDITFSKEIYSTTNSGEDFVRPGDQIVYKIDVEIPQGLSIHNLKLEGIVGDTLEIEKVTINGQEINISDSDWYKDLTGQDEDLEIFVYTRVKDDVGDNYQFTTESTTDISWESKYGTYEGEDGETITTPGKRPKAVLDDFSSDKDTFTEPGDEITFTGKVKNYGESTAYDTKLVAKLPEGTKPVEGTFGTGIYDEESNTITWIYDLPKGGEKEVTFKVVADGSKPVVSGSEVEFELEEYFSTADPEYTTRYEGTKETIDINATGNHAIQNRYDKEVTAGTTVILDHVLTNTGGSYDEFVISVDTDFPIKLISDGTILGSDANGDGSWDGGNTVKIKLAPGESINLRIEVEIPKEQGKGDTIYPITIKAQGQYSTKSDNAQNTIKIVGEDLDGWVSNSLWSNWEKDTYRDAWAEATYYPGSPLKLSAITTIDIDEVRAEIYSLDSFGNPVAVIEQLELTEYENQAIKDKEYKLWEVTDYVLSEDIEAGRFFVKFTALKNGMEIEKDEDTTSDPDDLGYNNYFSVRGEINLTGTIYNAKTSDPNDVVPGATVRLLDLSGNPVKNKAGQEYVAVVGNDGKYYFPDVKVSRYILDVKHDKFADYSRQIYVIPDEPNSNTVVRNAALIGFIIELKANPSTIVGDGKSTTTLTAKVTDEDGNPIAGVKVDFDAPIGTFLGEPTGITNEKGEAYIEYKSAKIEGIISQIIPVTAVVDDPVKDLHGEDQIFITFEPASIKGVVTEKDKDNPGKSKPVLGAKVIVTNNDIGFYGEAITDKDGNYKIAIPKGEITYDVEIQKPILLNGETEYISFKQKAKADEIKADDSEQEFPAEVTFTGVLLTKDRDRNDIIAGKGDSDGSKIVLKPLLPSGGINPNSSGEVDPVTGVFSVENLKKGETYEFVVLKEVNGKELLMGKIVVTLSDDGEINIHEELIDPYGTITNADTKEVLGGVQVVLYYANTHPDPSKRNQPVPQVDLGGTFDFPPNDNANPQYSVENAIWSDLTGGYGNYAWMVPPNTDYYIIATKAGYETYDSRNDTTLPGGLIKVGTDVVKYDFAMKPIKIIEEENNNGGGSGTDAEERPTRPTDPKKPLPPKETPQETPAEPGVDLSSNQRSYLEETEVELEIQYGSKKGNLKDTELIVKLPNGAVVKDPDGGIVEGDTIKWKLGDLEGGKIGSKNPIIELPKVSSSEVTIKIIAELIANGQLLDNPSTLNITVFSNRFGNKYHRRYIQGYPDGLFKPDRTITRAEIAVVFARILELEDLVKGEQMYADVSLDSWYARGVEAATRRGLFKGYDGGTFRPDQPITRGELAAVIARFLELSERPPVQVSFKDIENHWALNYISELYRNNVISGYEDGTFKPESPLRRSEAVTMINRMLNRGLLKGVEPSFPDVGEGHWANGDVEESTRSHEYYRNTDSSETHVKTIYEELNF